MFGHPAMKRIACEKADKVQQRVFLIRRIERHAQDNPGLRRPDTLKAVGRPSSLCLFDPNDKAFAARTQIGMIPEPLTQTTRLGRLRHPGLHPLPLFFDEPEDLLPRTMPGRGNKDFVVQPQPQLQAPHPLPAANGEGESED